MGYDPTGRLQSSTLNSTTSGFLYDGDELVAEYNSSGTVTRRYVHGIAVDDPQVMYIGSGTSDKRYLLANEQGSILALTNNSGALTTTHQYGPYGEPMDNSTERFRYTGQLLLTGTELYYYKARVYHPKLGRFMQTDPIGYDDGMNWYAYVGNDPVNNLDPTGESTLALNGARMMFVPVPGARVVGGIMIITGGLIALAEMSDEPDFGAAGELPDLTGLTPEEASEVLGDAGFEDRGKTEGGNSKHYHPDGSRVHVDTEGNVKVTGKKQDKGDGSGKYRPRLDKDRNQLPFGQGLDNHNTGEKLNSRTVTCTGSRIKRTSC